MEFLSQRLLDDSHPTAIADGSRKPPGGNTDSNTPISGDLHHEWNRKAAVARLRETGVDGVMIARECLAKPWIFAQIAALLRGEPKPPDPTPAEQQELVLHHYDLVCRRFGVERGTLLMRKFACAYAQGIPGARDFRGQVSRVTSQAEFLEVMARFFPTASPAMSST